MWRWEMGMKREKEEVQESESKGIYEDGTHRDDPRRPQQGKTHKVETQTWWWWRVQWVVGGCNPLMAMNLC
jgi:hypothetical protein